MSVLPRSFLLLSSKCRSSLVLSRTFARHTQPIERRIEINCKRFNVLEAMEELRTLFESGKSVPSRRIVGTLLQTIKATRSEEYLDEIMNLANQHELDPAFASAQISCLSEFNRSDEAWDIYKSVGSRIRKGAMKSLLKCLFESRDPHRINQLLAECSTRKWFIPFSDGIRMLPVAIENVDGKEWDNVGWRLLEYLRDPSEPFSMDLADLAVRWFTSVWKDNCSVDSNVEIDYQSGRCSSCGSLLQEGISAEQVASLLKLAERLLDQEALSFETNHLEVKEVNSFKQFVKRNGPFGAVVDGLNVYYHNQNLFATPDVREILRVSNHLQDYTKKPVLVLCRRHLYTKLKYASPSTMTHIQRYFKEENVYYYSTMNRVADDKFYVYAALSHPQTILVTNDTLGDYQMNFPNQGLVDDFKSWLMYRQVKIEGKGYLLKFPPRYSCKPQWDDTCAHVPMDNYESEWTCITKGQKTAEIINNNN